MIRMSIEMNSDINFQDGKFIEKSFIERDWKHFSIKFISNVDMEHTLYISLNWEEIYNKQIRYSNERMDIASEEIEKILFN